MIGLHNGGQVNLYDLWTKDSTGIEFTWLVMSEQGFRILLRAIRFNSIEENDRNRRLAVDKLAKI